MSTPDNPFGRPGAPQEQTAYEYGGATAGAEAPEAFPAWTGGDIVRVLFVLFAAMFFAYSVSVAIAAALPGFRTGNPKAMATDARVVVPSQAAAYLFTVRYAVRRIRRRSRASFSHALHWRFPQGWVKFVLLGAVLAIAIQLLGSKLPIPKQMPIDQFFRSPTAAWMMAAFGTLLAPFCEELFFRGLLFPVLVRRVGMLAGVVVTSGLFAVIHASQLAHAWAPVAMLFVVGVVLTLVRARTHSLAAPVLVHMGYNGALFALLYVGSQGFHNFTRIGR